VDAAALAGHGLPLIFLPLLKTLLLLAAPARAAWCARARAPLIAMGLTLAAVTAGILAHNTIVCSNPLKITRRRARPA
jgi:hypothetical protein